MTEFHCLAGNCKHNCCVGWEIDIDENTLGKYQAVKGKFGKRLFENIETNEDGAHFILTSEERCPFLNENNLCDIILTLGEDYLSDICRMHPRFYNARGPEIGYGLCCEEAARLLLYEPAALISDDEISFNASVNLFDTAEKIRNFSAFLLTLERLDYAWTDVLSDIRNNADKLGVCDIKEEKSRLHRYLVYRYASVEYADLITDFLDILCRRISFYRKLERADIIELCRLYSSEIEYSDVNVDLIFQYFGFEKEEN